MNSNHRNARVEPWLHTYRGTIRARLATEAP
jgi:hypothetical protein